MYIKNKFRIALYLLTVILLSSCFSDKKVTLFQNKTNGKDTIEVAQAYEAKIQPGDILYIYVNSLSTEASSYFNPYTANTTTPDAANAGEGLNQSASPGFLVDNNGNIDLPLVGTIPVNGLTTIEAKNVIKKKLEFYLKEPTVIVRILNYKISILGEVGKPGIYTIPNSRVTIPEVLSLAGDLTYFAKRDQIQIIRNVDNKKEFAQFDLTDRSIFASKFYYLHADDIIYVKAKKSRFAQSDLLYRILPLATTAITIFFLIYTRLLK